MKIYIEILKNSAEQVKSILNEYDFDYRYKKSKKFDGIGFGYDFSLYTIRI